MQLAIDKKIDLNEDPPQEIASTQSTSDGNDTSDAKDTLDSEESTDSKPKKKFGKFGSLMSTSLKSGALEKAVEKMENDLHDKDNSTSDTTQKIQSVETTATIVTETFQAEEKILPDVSASEQYEFATSFLKVGDYPTAERAFREFVISNPDHKLAGNAQYWYAETFRIRQLYTDAASAYLEGYQKYPKGEKAPINLLKLGVSMIQIGEKDQGCKMISGVEKQYPNANQSIIQKAKYESQKFECRNKIPNIYKSRLLNQRVNKIFKKFEKSFKINTNFIVGVSGGPDSLALAFLTKVYALKKNLNPKFFIVDHIASSHIVSQTWGFF